MLCTASRNFNWDTIQDLFAMPLQCMLCDSETFDAVDGLYYCKDCGTQSQDIRDEEAPNDALHRGHTLAKKRGGKTGRQKIPREKGKSWVSYEAYQIILKAQVEALISLGVDPSLKDTVGQLWFRYLQKIGVAFTGAPEGAAVDLNYIRMARDKKILDQNMKRGPDNQKKDDDLDELELCSELAEEEFYEEDNPFRDVNADEVRNEFEGGLNEEENGMKDNLDDNSDDEVIGSIKLKEVTKDKCYHPAREMTLHHTLSFCHLGLLWIREPVFLSDLLSWVKEGNLPYFEASTLLPSYMKFSGVDTLKFATHNMPKYNHVFLGSAQLAKFLDIPKLTEPNLLTYTSRYILDLHLPAVLHGVVNKLVSVLVPSTSYKPSHKTAVTALIPYELEAMAYIVIALGICYDFRDKTEGQKYEEFDPSTDRTDFLPVLTDWLLCRRHCKSKQLSRGVPWTNEELQQVRDPTKYTGFCAEEIYGSWARPDPILHEKRSHPFGPSGRSWHKENRSKYAELFKSLIPGEERENLTQCKEEPSSFRATCRHKVAADEESGDRIEKAASCFELLHLRGCSLKKLREDFSEGQKETNTPYLLFSTDEVKRCDSTDSSYVRLLEVLADYVSVSVERLHRRVVSLEHILFEQVASKRFAESFSAESIQ